MTRLLRALGLVVLGAIAASCTVPGQSNVGNAKPADLWAIVPSQAAVRGLFGDSNWFAGPPTFAVDPLDATTTPITHKFGIVQGYEHLGSDEKLVVQYTVYDKTSSATNAMTNIQTVRGQSISSQKIGDQALFYAELGSGGAPYVITTYVRVGQVVLALLWSKKDANITSAQLGKNAHLFADPLRDLGKTHAQQKKVDPHFLPPPGLDITALGSAYLPLESFVVMVGTALPSTLMTDLQNARAQNFAYGDYALNIDTSMEVQTGVLQFNAPASAASFATAFSPSPPDQSGIGAGYVKSGGTPAAGRYFYVFSQGVYSVLMICKASTDGQAATRDCEDPMQRTAIAWKAALANAGA